MAKKSTRDGNPSALSKSTIPSIVCPPNPPCPPSPPGPRFAFEFRNPDWLRPETFALLRRNGAAFCLDDWEGRKVPAEVTAEAVFMRFHGPLPGYHGRYSRLDLRRWAERMRKWAEGGLEVWAYFNNDADGAALHNALT